MGDIFIHLILCSKIGLHLDKAVGILLERDKKETCIKLTGCFVNTIRIRIGTAIEGLVDFFGQPHMCIKWKQVQVYLVKFILLAKGRSALLITTKGVFLLLQIGPVPSLKKHLDSADSHIRATLHPVLAITPNHLIKIFLLGDIGRAVFKTK